MVVVVAMTLARGVVVVVVVVVRFAMPHLEAVEQVDRAGDERRSRAARGGLGGHVPGAGEIAKSSGMGCLCVDRPARIVTLVAAFPRSVDDGVGLELAWLVQPLEMSLLPGVDAALVHHHPVRHRPPARSRVLRMRTDQSAPDEREGAQAAGPDHDGGSGRVRVTGSSPSRDHGG